MQVFNEDPIRESDTIRELCAKSLSEPVELWNALESNGIHVTPGVIHQAISDLARLQRPLAEPRPARVPSEEATALTIGELEAVASVVEKAGGVAPLMRFLKGVQALPK